MAPLLTKCLMLSTICAGQERFGQRTATSPSSRTTREPHEGHVSGICQTASVARCAFWITGPTTCGITSPARCTMTSSPGRMSLRWMSSSLCSVAQARR